jgi:hypothetical protein
MMQLYCPACENVVWIECNEPEETAACPECQQPIRGLERRKARPLNDLPPAPPGGESIIAVPGRITCPSWAPSGPRVTPAAEEESWEDDVEPDFIVDCPEPNSGYFVALPYRAEGGVSLARLPLFVAGVVLGGVALGALASTVGQVCYLILIFPLALGMALAGITILLGQLCHVRAPLVAGLVALVGGALALGTMHYLDYRHTLAVVESAPGKLPTEMLRRLSDSPRFGDYLEATAGEGLTISGGETGGWNLGRLGTYAYWGVECLLVLAIAALGGASGARAPYCSACRLWKEERFLGTLADAGPQQQKQLWSGRLSVLACYHPSLAGGALVFTAAICPRCNREAPIDLRVERNPHARPAAVSPNLPLHLTYPGAALPVLERLFTPV